MHMNNKSQRMQKFRNNINLSDAMIIRNLSPILDFGKWLYLIINVLYSLCLHSLNDWDKIEDWLLVASTCNH